MPRALNFRQIEAFHAVMLMGTTTSAALMLNTTQPSVSRRIAELQAATDLKLFELHRGRLRPTGEGKQLHIAVQQHFSGLRNIESVAATMRKSGTGVLRVGCTPTLGIGLLPKVIGAFLAEVPDTYIDLQTLGTPQLADMLHQDLFDVVLTTGTLDPRDFQPVVIRRTRAVCVLPLQHRLKEAASIELRRLKGDRVLSLSDSEESTLRIKSLLRKQGATDEFAIETTSSITICALVAAGIGVGIVNPYVASTFDGQLLIRPFAPAVEIEIQMALPRQTAPSSLTRRFVAMLTQQAGT